MTYQPALAHVVKSTGVLRCVECGKCTAVCPISQYDRHFSPRRTVGRALMRHDAALLSDDRLWACLTCLHCSQVCPAAVAYSDLTLGVRTEAHKLGTAAVCTHGETIHAWMRMMMNPGLKQKRLGWLGEATKDEGQKTNPQLRISESSDTLYFVGCAPYFDVQFGRIGVDGGGVARATLQVLNALGVAPQVLADERCCGHDLLWEGDEAGFRALAALNAEMIHAAGVKRVVTACPECARALKVDYPAHGFQLGVEVLHLAELLADHVSRFTHPLPLRPKGGDQGHGTRVTYQDPCRLGRHLGVYAAPRRVIAGLGYELVEMPRHAENALCCGTNGWTHCGAANRQIQGDRLGEAQSTGATVLVTACLKCQIHFKCALQDRQLGAETSIEIKDLATLAAESL
jgi:Fe-S oxidoreductase